MHVCVCSLVDDVCVCSLEEVCMCVLVGGSVYVQMCVCWLKYLEQGTSQSV